jgi:hypothetical protein
MNCGINTLAKLFSWTGQYWRAANSNIKKNMIIDEPKFNVPKMKKLEAL